MHQRELLKLQLPRIASVQDGASLRDQLPQAQSSQVLRKFKSGEWAVSSVIVRNCGMIWTCGWPPGSFSEHAEQVIKEPGPRSETKRAGNHCLLLDAPEVRVFYQPQPRPRLPPAP